MFYTQDERFQGRRSIKKRNQRKCIIDRGAGSESIKFNLQTLEVEELVRKHWSVDILTTGQQGKPIDIAGDRWKLGTTVRENSRRV